MIWRERERERERETESGQGGDQHESLILAGLYVFNANISFTFQAIMNLYAHPTYLCFGRFVNFLGVYLEINSFSQRISKIYKNRKF